MSLIRSLCTSLAVTAGALAVPQHPNADAAPPKQDEPRVGVRFEGLLPGTHDPLLEGEFEVEFRIYLSPQGGEAVWRESQRVRVTHGRMDVVLGAVQPISISIHEATFKFVGASVGGGREVYPRFTVVNTAYASPEEALRSASSDDAPRAEPTTPAARPGIYAAPGAIVSERTENACIWKQALLAARAAGGDLPDYADWYAALAQCSPALAAARTGHYEWVLPWVYDTASHGNYNRLYRGRFQGCDYMDLSPANAYVYRIARPAPAPASAAGVKQ